MAPMTMYIGPNGSGKSSALLALRLFFSPQEEIEESDFWRGRDGAKVEEVTIAVTFAELSTEAKTSLGAYLSEDESLTIERVFDEPGRGAYMARRLGVRVCSPSCETFPEAIERGTTNS